MSVTRLPSARKQSPQGYRMLAKGDNAEIYIYGDIGWTWDGTGITASQFKDDLKSLGSPKSIDVRINSAGGDVFDGRTIYTLLAEHKAKVVMHIDGLAASAASVIAMAGDQIRISEGAFLMIHNAWTIAMGGAEDMRKTATLLDQINGTIRETYAARTKQSMDQVQQWMDEETWFSGADAVKNGFADVMVDNVKVAASVNNPARYKHLPAALNPKRVAASAAVAAMKKVIENSKIQP